MKRLLPFLLVVLSLQLAGQDRELLKVDRSKVVFISDAPLEYITATNSHASGLIDPKEKTFAIQIPIVEFKGFNSPLQREHFNENYMLSGKFPNARFTGRIIETVDLSTPGEHQVRAKGEFTLKGVTKERIIPCKVIVTNEGIRVVTNFDVLLDDHQIRVPRVVQQKISSVVKVECDLLFKEQRPQ
jgi:hypothetical protein